MIGAVTYGFDSTQASATTAGFEPKSRATSTTRSLISSSCVEPSPSATLNASERPRVVAAFCPTPDPARYPRAIGDQRPDKAGAASGIEDVQWRRSRRE